MFYMDVQSVLMVNVVSWSNEFLTMCYIVRESWKAVSTPGLLLDMYREAAAVKEEKQLSSPSLAKLIHLFYHFFRSLAWWTSC